MQQNMHQITCEKLKIKWIGLLTWKCYPFSAISWTHIQKRFLRHDKHKQSVASSSLDWNHVTWPKWAMIPRITGWFPFQSIYKFLGGRCLVTSSNAHSCMTRYSYRHLQKSTMTASSDNEHTRRTRTLSIKRLNYNSFLTKYEWGFN